VRQQHPTPDLKPATSREAPGRGGEGGIRAALRGVDFATGEALLAPPPTDSPVQLSAPATDASETTHALARAGTAGAGGALPHRDRIQASFGRHDVTSIHAHTDSGAQSASRQMGAQGFATGDRVAFAEPSPSLHLAAHEAAHVIQQRAGVALSRGVGARGDAYEQHADAVADAVVRGESAEALLSQVAPGGGATSAVQLRAVEPGPTEPVTISDRRDATDGPATVDDSLVPDTCNAGEALRQRLLRLEGLRREGTQLAETLRLRLGPQTQATFEVIKAAQGRLSAWLREERCLMTRDILMGFVQAANSSVAGDALLGISAVALVTPEPIGKVLGVLTLGAGLALREETTDQRARMLSAHGQIRAQTGLLDEFQDRGDAAFLVELLVGSLELTVLGWSAGFLEGRASSLENELLHGRATCRESAPSADRLATHNTVLSQEIPAFELLTAEARHAIQALEELPGRVAATTDLIIERMQEAYVPSLAGARGVRLSTTVLCDRADDDRLWLSSLGCASIGPRTRDGVSDQTRRRAVSDARHYMGLGVPYTLDALVIRHARERSRRTTDGPYDLPGGRTGVATTEETLSYRMALGETIGPVPAGEDATEFLYELHQRLLELLAGDGGG